MPFYFKGGGNLIFKKMSLGIKESKKYFYFLLKLSARNPTGSIKSQYLENKFIHPTGGGGKNKKNALIFFFYSCLSLKLVGIVHIYIRLFILYIQRIYFFSILSEIYKIRFFEKKKSDMKIYQLFSLITI